MSTPFTDLEHDYLTGESRLGRLATVGRDGTPHVVPVGWSLDTDEGTIHVGGYHLETTKKFRDAARTGRATLLVDDVLPPWQPRGVEVRARAEARTEPEPVIVLHPTRIISWGIHSDRMGEHHARDVE